MEEISENSAARFSAKIKCSPPPEFDSLLRETDEDIQRGEK
jgi:hypothetical protein